MPSDPKDVLKDYLQGSRDTLIWKLDGLSERDQRLPRTPTGMNLLGIVKHALNTEVIYFGPTFGRDWPTPEELVPAGETDPQADWYATAQESSPGLVDLYQRVQRFADETIDALPLDAIGHVAHWRGAEVTLHEIMVHKIVDLQRHTGQADIVREQIDGATGLLRGNSNLPDDTDWPA
jgi:uncharacterized damage-inducible protein DinB